MKQETKNRVKCPAFLFLKNLSSYVITKMVRLDLSLYSAQNKPPHLFLKGEGVLYHEHGDARYNYVYFDF